MERTVSGHTYRTIDVPVAGGELRVGIWDPTDEPTADVLLVHGVTASHLAWPFVVAELPGVRVIAPDLRGRGRSNAVGGSAGLAAHAADLDAVLDALGIDSTVVVGHSMGAFVAVVFADLHPDRVRRLVLIDGGLPLDVPDLPADELVRAILGPTAARLSRRFADVEEYRAFWRAHPAFADAWTTELEEYIAYDLVDDGEGRFRPATSYETTVDDTVDLTTGAALGQALDRLRHPALFLSVPRGLQDETPGLYAGEYLDRLLPTAPGVRAVRLEDFNHYTVVMSKSGADVIADYIRGEIEAEG